MPLPIDMVWVRHGQSEGNVANKYDRAGDDSLLKSPGHRERHGSTYRLTDLGIVQAKAAGQWLRRNFAGQFDHYLVSSFVRARETAANLRLPGAGWEIDPYFVERDHGDLDGLSQEERKAVYGEDYMDKYLNNFYRKTPNGESRLDIGLRWDRMMMSLAQRHPEHRVIIVAHASIIEAGMIRRLHATVEEFVDWKRTKDSRYDVQNCQIIHFSRRNPMTGQVIESVRWWRTVCPWDLRLGDGTWQPIKKRRFTNRQLLEQIEQYPRLINP